MPPAFVGLVDDAAIFPPGNLPLPEAVEAHRAHRSAWYGALVGPFVVDAARRHLVPDDVAVSVVDGPRETAPAATYVEVPIHDVDPPLVRRATEAGHRLKFRTGGIERSAYPTPLALAGWIHAAVDGGVRFKCTAGLHRAVKRDPDHGFLNVLAATAAARAGAEVPEIAALLETTDPAALLDADLTEARASFDSFGSCSIAEPLEDLIALGLVEEPR